MNAFQNILPSVLDSVYSPCLNVIKKTFIAITVILYAVVSPRGGTKK
jgi:hypothetical protein